MSSDYIDWGRLWGLKIKIVDDIIQESCHAQRWCFGFMQNVSKFRLCKILQKFSSDQNYRQNMQTFLCFLRFAAFFVWFGLFSSSVWSRCLSCVVFDRAVLGIFAKESGLVREFSSNLKPTFYTSSFPPATPTHRKCTPQINRSILLNILWCTHSTQLPLARWRLHCIPVLVPQNGRGKGRQLHCLGFLRCSHQMEWSRKDRQLRDLG